MGDWERPVYERCRHCVYRLTYHFVWIPKYRRPVLRDDVVEYLGALINEIASSMGCKVLGWAAPLDHVHLVISCPPSLSPSTLANRVKGYTGYFILKRFPWLRSGARYGSLWSRSYFVESVGRDLSALLRYVAAQRR